MSCYAMFRVLTISLAFLLLFPVVFSVEVNFENRSGHVVHFTNQASSLNKHDRFLSSLILQSHTLSVPESFLFVSTLDGTMHAVKKQTGEIKWSLKEGERITR